MTSRLITQATCDRLRRLCEVHTHAVAAEIAGVDVSTISKLRKRGWRAVTERRGQRARPSDFHLQCNAMKISELCRHYRAGDSAVRRWSREVGRIYEGPRAHRPVMPMPDGSTEALDCYDELGTPAALAELVRRVGAAEAARSYGVSYGTLRNWRHRLGLPVSWSRQPGARRGHVAPKPSLVGWADQYFAGPAVITARREA